LTVVRPDLANGTIVGITCAILVLLYGIQPLGVSKLAIMFAPIVIIWLLFNFAFGVYVGFLLYLAWILLLTVLEFGGL
jgi:KUP system potassium uptake protein